MNQQVLFEDRFLENFVGSIVTDPAIAIVELVANCWDAYATEVKIGWPNRDLDRMFVIADNGIGMTRREFESRWCTLAYDRRRTQGRRTDPPAELAHLPARSIFGRYGKRWATKPPKDWPSTIGRTMPSASHRRTKSSARVSSVHSCAGPASLRPCPRWSI